MYARLPCELRNSGRAPSNLTLSPFPLPLSPHSVSARRDVLDEVAAQLVAVRLAVGGVVMRYPFVGAGEEDVGFEQPVAFELDEFGERGVELLDLAVLLLLPHARDDHAQRVGLLGEAVAVLRLGGVLLPEPLVVVHRP